MSIPQITDMGLPTYFPQITKKSWGFAIARDFNEREIARKNSLIKRYSKDDADKDDLDETADPAWHDLTNRILRWLEQSDITDIVVTFGYYYNWIYFDYEEDALQFQLKWMI